jgi:Tfp pilus assembly protein PilZ
MKPTKRYLAQIDATFLSRSQNVPFLTDHVTPEGVFVRTDSPPRAMELVRIELTLPPTSNKIVLNGVVTRMVPPSPDHAAPGAQITFFAKDGNAGHAWDDFIAFLGAKHPESLVQTVKLGQRAVDQVRRMAPRVDAALAIRIESRGEETVAVDNISHGGMFIRTRESFSVGAGFRVLVPHPRTFAAIAVECVVRRVVSGENAGVGVEFQNVTHMQRELLKELVQIASAAGGSIGAPMSLLGSASERLTVKPGAAGRNA